MGGNAVMHGAPGSGGRWLQFRTREQCSENEPHVICGERLLTERIMQQRGFDVIHIPFYEAEEAAVGPPDARERYIAAVLGINACVDDFL
jgi:hypothetical protein